MPTAADKIKLLKEEIAELKKELKLSKKREAGLLKLIEKTGSSIEKTIVKFAKKELAALDKALKPKKKRGRKPKNG